MRTSNKLDTYGQSHRGLVTARHLDKIGTGRRQRRKLVDRGVFIPVNRNVFRVAGSPEEWEQKLLAVCLAAGRDAVASHRAAAVVWDFADPPAPLEITVAYKHRPLPKDVIRHRTRQFRAVDRVVRHGIPTTAPARTLLDLAAVAPEDMPAAVERCLYQRLLTTAGLWRILDELGGPGRRGTRVLRDVLENRSLGDEPPQSLLESVMGDVIASTGIDFRYQHPVELDGCRYFIDFAAPALMLACEVDGLAVHGSRPALDSDLERQNRLIRHRWTVLRYTSTHLKERPDSARVEIIDVARQLAEVKGTLRRL